MQSWLPKFGEPKIASGEDQHCLAIALSQRFHEDELQLLFVGGVEPEAWNDPQYVHRFYFGLILLRRSVDGQDFWSRLGVCQWVLLPKHVEAVEASFLVG